MKKAEIITNGNTNLKSINMKKVTEEEPVVVNTENVAVTEKVPPVLLEILVYGNMKVEGDKEKPEVKMQKFLKNLTTQINSIKKGATKVRALWIAEKGATTIEDRKRWLIENSVCKYYVIIDDNYVISPTFVKDSLLKIKKLEDAIKNVKEAKITVKKINTVIASSEENIDSKGMLKTIKD